MEGSRVAHVAVTVADNVGEDANDVLTRRLRGAA